MCSGINTGLSIAGSSGGGNKTCSSTQVETLGREINLRGGKSLCSPPSNGVVSNWYEHVNECVCACVDACIRVYIK